MRIGQYSESFLPVVDGVGRVVVSYAQTMGEMGHAVTVFAPKTDMGDMSAHPYSVVTYNAFAAPGKFPYHIGLPQLDLPFERKVHGLQLDIVHAHSPFMAGRSALHLAKKRGLPIVGSFHSKYYDDFMQALKVDSLARTGVKTVVEFYQQCDEVWAVSNATADTLHEYGYKGEIIPMPNGTDLRQLDEAVLPGLRARYGLHEGESILLYVGQMNWKKNIRRILEAARLLRDRQVSFKLLIAGQGIHADEIAEASRQMGIERNVVMTGHVASTRELDGLYTLADLFVFPSLYDNAPMVLREAAVMHTPGVLVRGSTAAEVIDDGVNGLVCDDTSESLAQVLQQALGDPAHIASMGDAASRTIPISWRSLMDEVLSRYERLVARR